MNRPYARPYAADDFAAIRARVAELESRWEPAGLWLVEPVSPAGVVTRVVGLPRGGSDRLADWCNRRWGVDGFVSLARPMSEIEGETG
jgi:hypothetical protein